MISLKGAALAVGSVVAYHIFLSVPATARDGVGFYSLGPSSTSLWVTRLKSVTPKPHLPVPRSLRPFQSVDEIAKTPGAFELSLAAAAPGIGGALTQTEGGASETGGAERPDAWGQAQALAASERVRRVKRASGGNRDSFPQSLWQLASTARRQWTDIGPWANIGGLSAAVIQNVRFEGEMSQAVSQSAGGVTWAQPDGYTDIPSWSNMFNGYVDFDTGTKLTPYVGAGLGTVTYNLGGSGLGNADLDSENAFNDSDVGYQGMAGLSYVLPNNWSLSAEYRYAGALDYGRSYHATDEWDDTSHSARINFTKSFDLLQ